MRVRCSHGWSGGYFRQAADKVAIAWGFVSVPTDQQYSDTLRLRSHRLVRVAPLPPGCLVCPVGPLVQYVYGQQSQSSPTLIDSNVTRIRFEYLVGRPNGIEHLTEVHELGLFTTAEQLRAFQEIGLKATHDPVGIDGRGVFVAREEPDLTR